VEWVHQRHWAYRREITVPADLAGRKVRLRFVRIHYETEVLLGQIPIFTDRFDGHGQGVVEIHFGIWSHAPMNPK